MKLHKLKNFIFQLNKLEEIDKMEYFKKPDLDNLGNHCKLIKLVIPNIRELKEIYIRYKILENYYEDYAYALSLYLGFNSNNQFNNWKRKFPYIYGHGYEYDMFSSYKAFNPKNILYFNKSIIDKWIFIHNKILFLEKNKNKNKNLNENK